jgi:hypothetical protein
MARLARAGSGRRGLGWGRGPTGWALQRPGGHFSRHGPRPPSASFHHRPSSQPRARSLQDVPPLDRPLRAAQRLAGGAVLPAVRAEVPARPDAACGGAAAAGHHHAVHHGPQPRLEVRMLGRFGPFQAVFRPSPPLPHSPPPSAARLAPWSSRGSVGPAGSACPGFSHDFARMRTHTITQSHTHTHTHTITQSHTITPS